MNRTSAAERQRLSQLPRHELEQFQLDRLNSLLAEVVPHNAFYAEKLQGIQRLDSLAQLSALPCTYKHELVGSGGGGFARNLTYSADEYVRFHQTSGTRGRPMIVLDTAADWPWWLECWQYVLDTAEVQPRDRALLAFSFGPFIGFWTAFEALVERGCLVVPGGGMNTLSRLELLRNSEATLLFCTPSYALHMAEVAAEHQIDVAGLPIRCLILAGEPGGSVSSTRARIEQAWQARVLDHCGASEVGAWGYGDAQGRGLSVIESEFIAEFLATNSREPAAPDEPAELVLTNLGRHGCPAIRYRTGDLVRPMHCQPQDRGFVFLEGGVLGRSDDMMIIRGVNVFPSAVEQIVHGFPEVAEYRLTVRRVAEMDQMEIEIEDRLEQPDRVATELRLRLGLKVDVRCVPLGSLPRYEGKGKRFIDERS